MELLITIYFAINIFIGGIVFSQCVDDGDSLLSTFAMTLLYIAFGLPIAIIVLIGILIANYRYKKYISKKK
jgi:hypothetical protein